MEVWQTTSLILCVFGLLKEFRPSESFITEYLIGFKNVTTEQVIHELYPLSTYTVLATSLVIFLVTDLLQYRPVIIFQGISFTVCWITLIWGQSYVFMMAAQVLYGVSLSADVAYYTYMYAQVDREHYQKVTSYSYTAGLMGKFCSSLSAQILVSFNILNFHELVYLTLTAGAGAFTISILLPSVKKSMYFNRLAEDNVDKKTSPLTRSISSPVDRTRTLAQKLKRAYTFLWIDFKDAYSKPYVLKWSLWWAFAYAGNLQVVNYTQPMWERIDSFTDTKIYNGGVGAVQCLLSAFLTLCMGHVKISWNKWGESLLCLNSIFQGFGLIWLSQTNSLYIGYGAYIIFRVLYQLVVSIASSEVAQGVTKDSCGLVFGINTSLALVIQTILTIVVTDKRGLALDERSQFVVYGCYFLVLGIIFLVIIISTFCQNQCDSSSKTEGRLGEYENPEDCLKENEKSRSLV